VNRFHARTVSVSLLDSLRVIYRTCPTCCQAILGQLFWPYICHKGRQFIEDRLGIFNSIYHPNLDPNPNPLRHSPAMHTLFDILYRPPCSLRPMFRVTLREAAMKILIASLASAMLTEAVVAKNRKAGLNYYGIFGVGIHVLVELCC
jgi:hypothetical protein